MPIFKLEGPDGRIYRLEAPDGTPDEALKQALAEHLEFNPPPSPKSSFGAAMSSGLAGLQANLAEAGHQLGFRDDPADFVERQKKLQRSTYQSQAEPGPQGWLNTPWEKIKETAATSLPSMAAPLAGGLAGTIAGGPVGGAIGAFAPSALQFFGENVSRQVEEGTPRDQVNTATAAGTAGAQAALDTLALRFVPGVRNILGKFGKDVPAEIAAQTAKQVIGDFTKKAGTAALVEGGTEAAQQALSRWQAGLATMDPAAREEYLDAFLGGAALGGGLSVPGRAYERGQLKRQAQDERQQEEALRAAEARKQAEADEAAEAQRRQSPGYLHDVQARWDEMQNEIEKLKLAGKTVEAGPFANEQRFEIKKKLAELHKSEEYKSLREEYREAYPLIQRQKSVASKMAGQTDPLAGRRDEPVFPPAQPAPPPELGDIASKMMADPALAERIKSGEVHIPGVNTNALLSLYDMQRKAQIGQQVEGYRPDMMLMYEEDPATVPPTNEVIDSEAPPPDPTKPQAPAPMAVESPQFDNAWEKALSQQPVAGDSVPQPDVRAGVSMDDRLIERIDQLYDDKYAAHKLQRDALNARERDLATQAITRATEARKELDAHLPSDKKLGAATDKVVTSPPDTAKPQRGDTPIAPLLVDARDRQEEAVTDMLETLDTLRSGQYLGHGDSKTEHGKAKPPKGVEDPAKKPSEYETDKDITPTPWVSGSQTGGTSRPLLVKRFEKAADGYIDAAIEEAAARRRQNNEPLSQEEAEQFRMTMRGKFKELLDRMTAKRGLKDGWNGQPDAEPKVARNGDITTQYTLHDNEITNAPVVITIKRDKYGKVLRMDAEFKRTGARTDFLKALEPDGQGGMRPGSYGPGHTDKWLLDQLLERGFDPLPVDQRPLEQRPFGNVKAAMDVILDDINQTTRAFAKPQRAFQHQQQELKQQFASQAQDVPQELKAKAAHVLRMIDKALTRAPSGKTETLADEQRPDGKVNYGGTYQHDGLKEILQRAKQYIEDGKVSGDLLDATARLAQRVINGTAMPMVQVTKPVTKDATRFVETKEPVRRNDPKKGYSVKDNPRRREVGTTETGKQFAGYRKDFIERKPQENDYVRDVEDAMLALDGTTDGKPSPQRDLPGMEPTAFERQNAKNFQNAPQVRQNRLDFGQGKEPTRSAADIPKVRAALDAVNRRIDALKVSLKATGKDSWVDIAFPELGKQLTPMEDILPSIARDLGPEWVAAREKVREQYNDMLATAAQLRDAQMRKTAQGNARVQEQLEVLDRQRKMLEQSLERLRVQSARVPADTLKRIEAERFRKEKVADVKAQLTETLSRLNAQRQEIIDQMEEHAEDFQLEEGGTIRELRQQLESARDWIKKTEATNDFDKALAERPQLTRAREIADQLEARLMQLLEKYLIGTITEKEDPKTGEIKTTQTAPVWDRQMFTLIANENSKVQALSDAYKRLEKLLESLTGTEKTEAEKAREHVRGEMVKAQKEAENLKDQMHQKDDAWLAKLTNGFGLEGIRRTVSGPQTRRTTFTAPETGVTRKREVADSIVTVVHKDGSVEKIKVPRWDQEFEVLRGEDGPSSREYPDMSSWSEGVQKVIENYAALYEKSKADAADWVPPKRGTVSPEGANTRATGPVQRDKYGAGKYLDQARAKIEKKTGASDAAIAERLKKGEASITKLREVRDELQKELADLAQKRLDLNKKIENEKDGHVQKKLLHDASELEVEIIGNSRAFHEVQDQIEALHKKGVKEADEKQADMEVVRYTRGPKKGQIKRDKDGRAIMESKQERWAKEAARLAREANQKNVNAAKRNAAIKEIEEDYDAMSDLMFGRVLDDEGGFNLTKDGKSFQVMKDYGDITPAPSAPWHGKTLKEAAAWGAATTKDPFERLMFTRLSQAFAKYSPENAGRVFGANFNDELDPRDAEYADFAFGKYESYSNLILVRNVKNLDDARVTLLHELVHAATVRAMDDTFLGSEIGYLHEDAVNWWQKHHPRKEMPYGLMDPYEFVAEANSNPEFQFILSQIPSSNPKKSIWDRFVMAVMKVLGLDKPSMLTDVFELTEKVLKVSEKTQGGKPSPDRWPVMWRRKTIPSAVFAEDRGRWGNMVHNAKGNATGMNFRVQFVDRLHAVVEALDYGKEAGNLDSWKAFAANYFLRFAEQNTNFSGQALTNGPMKLVKEKHATYTEERYRSEKGANMKSVADKIAKAGKAAGWSPQEAERMFEWLVVGARAEATPRGWERLHAVDHTSKESAERTKPNPQIARKEWQDWMARMNANPEGAKIMKDAAAEYKQFNDGLIDFAVACDAIDPEEGARLKSTPYAPFYRVVGGDVKLFIDNEHSVTIGNIKDQPDLQAMLGGDEKLLPVLRASVQNAFMLTRLALKNKAAKETAEALIQGKIADRHGKKSGPSGANVLHYKVKGENRWVAIDSDKFGIPAHLIVKGMEGIKTTIPFWVQAMGGFANVLRRGVTRSPAYWFRQVVRDPMSVAIGGGVDGVPILNALSEIAKEHTGGNPAMEELTRGGAISSHIFSGNSDDMTQFMREIAAGQSRWQKLFHTLDMAAFEADAATRTAVYRDGLAKGLTEAQAQFRALEVQNFGRRGLSPGMQMLSTIVPFFNAQVQGLDVMIRTFQGKVPFAEKLHIRRKLAERAALLMTTAVTYAALMQDDEDYRKAKPQERYQSFFVPVGAGDWLKVPIPFEWGLLFKAVPEALFDAAMGDATVKEAASGLFHVTKNSLPMPAPTAIWPLIQWKFNWSGFGELESRREQQLEPGQRYRENTSELAKWMGEYTGKAGISPIAIEHLTRGYLGPLGLFGLHMLDWALADDTVEKPSKTAAQIPMMGSMFQRRDGRFTVDRAYDRWNEIVKAQKTYEDMKNGGERAKAEQYRQEKATEIALAPLAGQFRNRMGKLMEMERKIRAADLSQEEKDRRLEILRRQQNEYAKNFFDRTTDR